MSNFETILPIATQIPLVAIFIWFVLRMLTITQQAQEKRDSEWRTFLEGERQARIDSTTRLAEELKQNTHQLANLQEALSYHDRETRTLLQNAMR